MHKKHYLLFTLSSVAIFLIFLISTYSTAAEEPGQTEGLSASSETTFGLNLFKEIAGAAPGENIFISPLSVSLALAMTLNGSEGATRDEMQRVLGFDDIAQDDINAAFREAIENLTDPDSEVILLIANSIWYRRGLTLEEDFLKTNREYFEAEITGLDFSSPEAADIINRWVSANTNEKIKQIVTPPIDPVMVMYLINAVYFKGRWTVSFDEKKTRPADFYISADNQTECDLMYRKDKFNYYENDLLQVADIPYGEGHFVMTVLLPRENVPLDDLIVRLGDKNPREWFEMMTVLEGNIFLPRFKTEYEITLNEILQKLGMPSAFKVNVADFSKIRPQKDLFISEVKHKTFVEVNEEGTEAAAVTSVGIALTAMREPRAFTLRCDRPFLYLIREKDTETLLFMGLMNNPSS